MAHMAAELAAKHQVFGCRELALHFWSVSLVKVLEWQFWCQRVAKGSFWGWWHQFSACAFLGSTWRKRNKNSCTFFSHFTKLLLQTRTWILSWESLWLKRVKDAHSTSKLQNTNSENFHSAKKITDCVETFVETTWKKAHQNKQQ